MPTENPPRTKPTGRVFNHLRRLYIPLAGFEAWGAYVNVTGKHPDIPWVIMPSVYGFICLCAGILPFPWIAKIFGILHKLGGHKVTVPGGMKNTRTRIRNAAALHAIRMSVSLGLYGRTLRIRGKIRKMKRMFR